MSARVRVVVVDSDEIVRAGLRALLAPQRDIHVIATAASAEDALGLIARESPDVATTAYRLPGMSGIEFCERVDASHGNTAMIMLTSHLEDDVVRGAIEAGARGYVHKGADGSDVCRAIRAVARGETVLDPKIAGCVARWARRHELPGRLSARERDVLRLVGRGSRTQDIAHALHVTENTVRTYVRRILIKLDCKSRSEAVAIAMRAGVL